MSICNTALKTKVYNILLVCIQFAIVSDFFKLMVNELHSSSMIITFFIKKALSIKRVEMEKHNLLSNLYQLISKKFTASNQYHLLHTKKGRSFFYL